VSQTSDSTTGASVDSAWIDEVVARVVATLAPDKPATVGRNESLIAHLGYDSLLLMELRFALEELFALDVVDLEDPPPVGEVWQLQEYMAQQVRAQTATVPTSDVVTAYLQGA
jgi:hypothetical protein